MIKQNRGEGWEVGANFPHAGLPADILVSLVS